MTWRLPDTYHSAGNGQGTATLKFYEGRDNLDLRPHRRTLKVTTGHASTPQPQSRTKS
jgi:3-phenylpropionate/cinnamic acid dioxygenase small subunit